MQKKNIVMIVAGILVCCFFTASVYAEEAQERIQPSRDIRGHQVIRLNHLAGLSPSEVTVKAGTTVIWMNDARVPVQLRFKGQQVTMACRSPVNFIIDEQGSFISNLIPQGSVASLCFVEKGTFEYVFSPRPTASKVKTRAGTRQFRGTITVE